MMYFLNRDSEEEIDLPDDQAKPLAKTGIIMSNVRHEMIELRDLEEARCSRSGRFIKT